MSTKRIYHRVQVNDVSFESLKEMAIEKGESGTTVGLDVAKHEIVVSLRWSDATYQRPWRVKNPSEISLLIQRLCLLKEICGSLTIGLESTGTYSEAVRMAMTCRLSGSSLRQWQRRFGLQRDLRRCSQPARR